MKFLRRTASALVGLSILITIAPGQPLLLAAEYPTKVITLICPFPPGGTMDGIARAAAESVRKHLPKPVAVVNRPGGAGTIGVAEVFQAKPDGYTIGISGMNTLTISPHTADLPFKGPDDVTPFISLANAPLVLAVGGHTPFKSLKDLLDASNANPGKVRIATSAIGTIPNILVQRLKIETNAGFVIVPYTGGGEPVAALLGGHVDATLETPLTVRPHSQVGKMRVVAVFGGKRTPSAPEAPTLKEAGVNLEGSAYYYLLAPKDTPASIAKMLHDAFQKGMQEEVFVKFLQNTYLDPFYLSGPEIFAKLKSDYEAYAKITEQLGLKKK